ncbi:glycosyltransferase [Singulisphaera sp. PoT]|uniref:glycosyltransferase n=1 Tax=Singulisphaera sp. PoT TaxID=3411797 RepID=UPI003BF513E0
MTKNLKVTHVVLSLECGGLERIVLDLARTGPKLGQEVSVICMERRGKLADQVEEAGATVLCLDKPPGRDPEMVGKVREALRQLKPNVVHTHQIGPLLYAGPAAQAENVPLVVHTEHINQLAKHRSLSRRLRLRILWWLAGRRSARFFCVSDDIAAAVHTHGFLPKRKIHVVLNGIDTAQFRRKSREANPVRSELGIPPGAPLLGTVGRLNEVKCQDLLVRSFQRILKDVPEAHLLLVGDGPMWAELHELADRLEISDRVHFAGYQAEPERFLKAMDVFVLPSRAEGLPLAILEAWAVGLPVIATRVGGIPRLLDEGRDGILIDPNDEQALTSSLLAVLSDPEHARKLGEAGRRRAEADFDTCRMATDYQTHYLQLLTPGN